VSLPAGLSPAEIQLLTQQLQQQAQQVCILGHYLNIIFILLAWHWRINIKGLSFVLSEVRLLFSFMANVRMVMHSILFPGR